LPALARYQALRDATSRRVSDLNHHLAELPEDLDETERRLGALLKEEALVDAMLANRP
jgi:hypothetical protein